MVLRVDSHHHFWNYSVQEYGWIGEPMKAIRRTFEPSDLKAAVAPVGVDAVVSVQARQTVEETDFLLAQASKNEFIRGVVGWVPLVEEGVENVIEHYKAHAKFKGVRHVVQDEPDVNFIMRDDLSRGVSQLKKFGLVYDILIFERQLKPSIQFVDRHPDQVFVLDHIAKPKIKAGELEPWTTDIREMAKRPNVYCKISGMVTEADWETWTPETLRPYIDTVLEAFGPKRLMFGSDWPVMLVACPYSHWWQVVNTAIAGLSESERDRILGLTAVEAYKL
ncbi:MAG TPA: amidohydrolase family protein [Bryobacteraceae bacterium]|nr:amidohydrolase family protein [Bryobacteraceae bacterium]